MTRVPPGRLIAVELDPQSLSPVRSFIDEERAVAVRDLIADNLFSPVDGADETYRLHLSVAGGRLVLDVSSAAGTPRVRHVVALGPLRRVLRDYFLVCDACHAAAHGSAPVQIEAIDAGRRGLHNEGAEILRDALSASFAVDFPTARRLFTLVCALHWKG